MDVVLGSSPTMQMRTSARSTIHGVIPILSTEERSHPASQAPSIQFCTGCMIRLIQVTTPPTERPLWVYQSSISSLPIREKDRDVTRSFLRRRGKVFRSCQLSRL